MDLTSLNARIRDRIAVDWLAPSQRAVWEQLMVFDGPPHRVVNVFGAKGVGKSFIGWLLERERLATYGLWNRRPTPTHPRLVLDNALIDHISVRSVRPLVDELGVQQIILISRGRADEPAMPAFELQMSPDDLQYLIANLYRHLNITIPEGDYRSFRAAIDALK